MKLLGKWPCRVVIVEEGETLSGWGGMTIFVRGTTATIENCQVWAPRTAREQQTVDRLLAEEAASGG